MDTGMQAQTAEDMNFKDKFQEHLSLNKELDQLVRHGLKLILTGSGLRNTAYNIVALSLLLKNQKHFNAVQELCKVGYGEDAGLLVRSMTNSVIDLEYIAGKQILSERFLEYDWVIKKNKIQILDEYFSAQYEDSKKISLSNRKREVDAKVCEFKEKYNVKNNSELRDWSGLKILNKADVTGQTTRLLYQTVYKYFSNFEHGNVSSLEHYIKVDESEQSAQVQVTLCSGPSENFVEMSLRESFQMYIRMSRRFFEAVSLSSFIDKLELLALKHTDLYGRNSHYAAGS